MARDTRTIGITEGRDAGKKFLLTEKPAVEAEKVATFAIMAAVRGGAAISPEMGRNAFVTLQNMSVSSLSLMAPADADYVFGKLAECVLVVNAGGGAQDMDPPRKPIPTDFEEIDTIWRLRTETIELHTSFLERLIRSILARQAAKASSATSSNTPTGPQPAD